MISFATLATFALKDLTALRLQRNARGGADSLPPRAIHFLSSGGRPDKYPSGYFFGVPNVITAFHAPSSLA